MNQKTGQWKVARWEIREWVENTSKKVDNIWAMMKKPDTHVDTAPKGEKGKQSTYTIGRNVQNR